MSDTAEKLALAGVRIVEGAESTWHYHLCLSVRSTSSAALCGAMTMHAEARIEDWGFRPDHIPMSYCTKCEKIALENKEKK